MRLIGLADQRHHSADALRRLARHPSDRDPVGQAASAVPGESFDLRGTHPWSRTLTVEPTWPNTYPQLAAELACPTKAIAGAIARVQALIDKTQSTEPPDQAT